MTRILTIIALLFATPAVAKTWEFVLMTDITKSKIYLWQSARKGKNKNSIQIYQRVEYGTRQDTGELSAAFLLEIDCKNETLEELEMTTFDSAGLKGKKSGSFNLKDLEIETLRGWGRKGGADYQFANYACKKFKK